LKKRSKSQWHLLLQKLNPPSKRLKLVLPLRSFPRSFLQPSLKFSPRSLASRPNKTLLRSISLSLPMKSLRTLRLVTSHQAGMMRCSRSFTNRCNPWSKTSRTSYQRSHSLGKKCSTWSSSRSSSLNILLSMSIRTWKWMAVLIPKIRKKNHRSLSLRFPSQKSKRSSPSKILLRTLANSWTATSHPTSTTKQWKRTTLRKARWFLTSLFEAWKIVIM